MELKLHIWNIYKGLSLYHQIEADSMEPCMIFHHILNLFQKICMKKKLL